MYHSFPLLCNSMRFIMLARLDPQKVEGGKAW